jgi:hypothetical protein
VEEGSKRGVNGRMARPQLHGHLVELDGRGVEEGCKRKNGRASIARSCRGAKWKRGGRGVQTEEWQGLNCTVIWWSWVEEGWKRVQTEEWQGLNYTVIWWNWVEEGCKWKNGRASTPQSFGGARWKRVAA